MIFATAISHGEPASCPPPAPQPAGTAVLAPPYPVGLHAFAQGILDKHLATNSPPMGGVAKGIVNGVPVVAQVTHHTICNGVPGCCEAVTCWKDLEPDLDPSPIPLDKEPRQIDVPVVVASALAGAAVVGGFWLALRLADSKRRR